MTTVRRWFLGIGAVVAFGVLAASASATTIVFDSLAITPYPLPPATIGQEYHVQLGVEGKNGVVPQPPYQWELTGSLPYGLTFDAATGVISGYPSFPQTQSFRIDVTDANEENGIQPESITAGTGTPADDELVPTGNLLLSTQATVQQTVNSAGGTVVGVAGVLLNCVPSYVSQIVSGTFPRPCN